MKGNSSFHLANWLQNLCLKASSSLFYVSEACWLWVFCSSCCFKRLKEIWERILSHFCRMSWWLAASTDLGQEFVSFDFWGEEKLVSEMEQLEELCLKRSYSGRSIEFSVSYLFDPTLRSGILDSLASVPLTEPLLGDSTAVLSRLTSLN